MSQGIAKETYVQADDKTTKALTYDLLNDLHSKVDSLAECQRDQVKSCDGRFRTLENNKKRNAAIAASTGFGGGFVAIISTYVKQWLS